MEKNELLYIEIEYSANIKKMIFNNILYVKYYWTLRQMKLVLYTAS